jgi:hypothetical protein
MQTLFTHFGKLTALLMMLASGLSWWLAPGPQAPLAARSRDESWILPVVSRGNTEKSAEKSVAGIVAGNLWGAVQTAAEVSLIDPEWRFSGVTVSGQEKLVMITIEGQPMQALKAGDQLPGDAKILKINDDHLCLLIKGKKRKLDLF